MTGWRLKSYLSLLWLVALLGLLVLLAVLQYRWTGEASKAEQERLRRGLNESLSYLERSFDREFTLLLTCYWRPPAIEVRRRPANLRGQPEQAARTAQAGEPEWLLQTAKQLAESSRRWNESAEAPRLLADLLVVIGPRDAPSLFRFSPTSSRLDRISWPSELLRIRALFGQNDDESQTRSHGHAEHEISRLFTPHIVDEPPALIVPLGAGAERRRLPGREAPANISEGESAALVIRLSRSVICDEWIPALAKRYLPSEEGGGYEYALTGRSGSILCSFGEFDRDELISSADASVTLMQLRFAHFEEWGGEERPAAPAPRGAPGGFQVVQPHTEATVQPPPSGVPGGFRVVRPHTEATVRSQASPAEAREQDVARAKQELEERYAYLQRFAEVLAAQSWRLAVKNKSGSLDRIVAAARARNLAISLGILLVLAASLVALAASVRRARRLARQQMEFVAGVSHELRTPIAVICSNAENLADGLIKADDQVRRYGNFILREGRRLGALVEQTLEYAGIGSGQKRLDRRPVDLGRVVSQTIAIFEPALRAGQTAGSASRIETRLDSPPAAISGDAASLGCVVENLLSNAVKYSPSGGVIRVSVRNSPDGDAVELEVTDQGMGIERAELRRVAEPFFRGSNAVEAQIRGAGIGLSLVRSIVSAHQGSLEIRSELGKGTTVTVRFPALKEGAETGARAGVPRPEEHQQTTSSGKDRDGRS